MTIDLATKLLILIGSCTFIIAAILAIAYFKARFGATSEDIDPYNGDGF